MRRTRLAVGLAAAVAVLPVAVNTFVAHAGGNDYQAYELGFHGGEPTLGYDPKADATLYAAGTTVLRLRWDDKGRLAQRTDVTPPLSPTTLDTILLADPRIGRTYVSYLAGACSVMAFSDDAGASWNQSQGCGPGALLDHQTVGAGPAPATFAANPLAQDLVYYCAQNSYSGACATSLDGGRTFGPGVEAYNTPANSPGDPLGGSCSALHGHLRVGPDGTAYLPIKGCGGQPTADNLTNTEFWGGSPAVSVSQDGGITWTVHTVPGGQNPDESDPSVSVGPKGTVFLGWEDGTNPSVDAGGTTTSARIAVSHDKGRTWSKPYDVSSELGIKNVQFPEVITGDDDRAAFAFIGTKSAGDDQLEKFQGEWHLYVATTYDGGKSWTTVDATPHDPVQRGCVDLQGTSNKSLTVEGLCGSDHRNMLDFNDITVDKQGRVLVAYTDGCTGQCVKDPSVTKTDDAMYVLRQSAGRGLYAAYDGKLNR